MKKSITLLLVFVLVVSSALFGNSYNTPPDILSVQQVLNDCMGDILLIIDYLHSSGYTSVYINDDGGTILADSVRITIPDEEVRSVVDRLIGEKRVHFISKKDNTVILELWEGFGKDIGCGIAYTTTDNKLPDVQFATEILPLEEINWYYYVTDYNAWRAGERP